MSVGESVAEIIEQMESMAKELRGAPFDIAGPGVADLLSFYATKLAGAIGALPPPPFSASTGGTIRTGRTT